MSDLLLATKLLIPPPRANLVSRPRLLEQFDAGLAYPLMLVSAPPGFGKSTAVADWARGCGAHDEGMEAITAIHVAWFAITEEDNDLARFFTYVGTALNVWSPGLSDMVLALVSGPQLPAPLTVATALINSLSQLPRVITNERTRDYVLVLDDYHLIQSASIHNALAFVVDHSPPQFHILLTSRIDPPLPLAMWRARGQMAEVRADDLRFLPDEAQQFLNDTMDLALTSAATAMLEARTEGWAAGLQLAALALRGHPDRNRFLQEFTGGHRYILGYLADEVLARQPEDMQHFLLQTAILERLNGSLCDAVTGEADSYARLETLHRMNLFTIALDEHGEWYRYHHLFRDVLRVRLQHTQPHLLGPLHQRASLWYEAHGLRDEAIEHALDAQDLKRAGHLIVDAFLPLWKQSALNILRRWFERMPDAAFAQDGELAFWSAALLTFIGQLDVAEHRLEVAEREYAIQADAPNASPAVTIHHRGRVAWLRSTLAARRGDIERSLVLAEAALAFLPPEEILFRGGIYIAAGLGYYTRGQLMAAHHAYEQAATCARTLDHWFLLSGALGRLAIVQLALGRLHAAAASCHQLVALPIVQRGSLPASGYAHVGLAEVAYQWDELDKAVEHAEKAVVFGETASIVDLVNTAALTCARVHAARGEYDAAMAMVELAHASASAVAGDVGLRRVQAVEARINLQFGALNTVTHWVRIHDDASAVDPMLTELEGILMARWQLADGKPAAALATLEPLFAAASQADRQGSVIEILTLQAQARAALGQSDEALAALESALRCAEPEGYLRVFVDAGPTLVELLRAVGRLRTATDLRAYIGRVLAAFSLSGTRPEPDSFAASPSSTTLPPQPLSTLIEPLTEREEEVLRLVGEGATNDQIATALVISIHTVRKHISNILGKLDVANRTEAIARARTLGLL